MNAKQIASRFDEMGARVKLNLMPGITRGFRIDIQKDTDGEFFDLRVPEHPAGVMGVSVLQVQPKDRHLLLLVRHTAPRKQVDRFLCGHDEREWFVAAVPGGASSVAQAKLALKPALVREAEAQNELTARQRNRRKNRAFRRQGEWFFVPVRSLTIDPKLILKDEPIRRGSGKPHWVEELYRTGGTRVYVNHSHPNGLTEKEYQALLRRKPAASSSSWRVMQRDPLVYARGTVRHFDHATITLPDWHRVVMNTETQSRSMRNMAFLD
ncbi:MAG: hypothetical protein L0Z50_23080 [Verrucomicrobiales bacterium]|nr:hypothetical protein [Verrucomicrobiales bacterium]